MPKTNKSLAKLIDIVNKNSSSNLKNIETISNDISSLKDLLIEDRALNAKLRKQRSSENKNAKILSDDLDEIRSKRNKIDSEIASLLNEEKTLQKNQQKADKKKEDEDSTYYSKLGDKELQSGNLVSGLLFSFLGRNEKNQEEIEKENKQADSDERRKRLDYLENEKTDNAKERQSRVNEFKKQTKTKSPVNTTAATPEKTKSPVNTTAATPEKTKVTPDPGVVDQKYSQRDAEIKSPSPIVIQNIIDPVTVEISKISEQCLSDLAKVFASSGGSGSGSGFDIPDFDMPDRRGKPKGRGRGRGPSRSPSRGPTGRLGVPRVGVPRVGGSPGFFAKGLGYLSKIPGVTRLAGILPGLAGAGAAGAAGAGVAGAGAAGAGAAGAGVAGAAKGAAGAARLGAGGALKVGARLLGKAALPLTIAMAAIDGYQGATDEGVNSTLSSREGRENEPITATERLRSGRANILSGLTAGLIPAKVIADAFESPLGQLVELFDPFTLLVKGLEKMLPGLDKLKDLAKNVGGVISDGLKGAAKFFGFTGNETVNPVDPLVMTAEKQKNADLLTEQMKKRGFNDKQIAAGLGVTAKESGLVSKSENLDYANTDNTRIRQLFGNRVAGKTDEELNTIKKDPEKMGETMYGKDTDIGKGMGNTEVGDGWKYRGRGFIQLTGKSNYAAASKAIFGDDTLVQNPDRANEPAIAAEISAWYLDKRGKDMAGKMGVDLAAASQEDVNRVMVSAVAGSEVKAGQGITGTEGLAKTDAYAKQFGGDTVNRFGAAGAAKPSMAAKAPFGAGGDSGGGGASDSFGEQAGGNYNAKQLSDSGLKLRGYGDVQAAGAYLDENLVNLSKQLPSIVDAEKIAGKPGEEPLKFVNISGLNDAYHKTLPYKSQHTEGKAVDFTLNRRPTKEEGEKLVALLKTKGKFSEVIDEYNKPSGAATGNGHIHAEVAGTSSDKSSAPSAVAPAGTTPTPAGAPPTPGAPEMVGKSPFGGGGDSGGGGASDSWGEPAGTVTPATKETAVGAVATVAPSLMAYQEQTPIAPTVAKTTVPTEVAMPNDTGVKQFVASKQEKVGAEEAGSAAGPIINAPQNSTVNNSQAASNKNVREKPSCPSNTFANIYNKLVWV